MRPLSTTTIASPDSAHDTELDLRIELGRAQMDVEDVLQLRRGSVVTLDALASDPVDVYADGQIVARGETLVRDGEFCVRVTELIDKAKAA